MTHRYLDYKPSGVQWLGDIPSHWEVKKLKYLCSIITGYTPSKNDEENYDENGFLWVKPDNLNEFNEILHTSQRVSVQGLRNNFLIPKGSILVCSIGTIGKMGIAGQDLITNQQINSFIFGRHIKNSFAKYMVFSAKRIFDFLANDNVVRILNASTQKHIFFAVPPLAEQTAIAHYLDRETAKIDALLQKQAELLAKLSEQRTALITHAVTKGLNPNVAMKNSGVQWLGDIPSHWEVKRLKHLGEIVLGLTYLPDDVTEDSECTLVLRSSNIKNNQLVFDDNIYVNKNIPNKMITTNQDILICSRNGSRSLIGKCALIEGVGINQTFGAFMTVYRTPYRKFIYYVLNSDIFKAQLGSFLTATINQLTTQVLGGLQIAFPSDEEQSIITQYLDNETAKIDALCDKIREMSERLTEYRTTLISDAVTGKIKVIP